MLQWSPSSFRPGPLWRTTTRFSWISLDRSTPSSGVTYGVWASMRRFQRRPCWLVSMFATRAVKASSVSLPPMTHTCASTTPRLVLSLRRARRSSPIRSLPSTLQELSKPTRISITVIYLTTFSSIEMVWETLWEKWSSNRSSSSWNKSWLSSMVWILPRTRTSSQPLLSSSWTRESTRDSLSWKDRAPTRRLSILLKGPMWIRPLCSSQRLSMGSLTSSSFLIQPPRELSSQPTSMCLKTLQAYPRMLSSTSLMLCATITTTGQTALKCLLLAC